MSASMPNRDRHHGTNGRRAKHGRQFADGHAPRRVRAPKPIDIGTKILIVATCAIVLATMISCAAGMVK